MRLILVLSVLIVSACAVPPPPETARPWRLPTSRPAGAAGAQIARGEALISQTARYLGPEMPDPALRVAGNHLACKNCHLQAGQQAHALGFVGVSARYPRYRGRENRVVSLAERVNGCFERSLNGRALPEQSPEMQAILAYMNWLSEGYPSGSKVQGQGLPPLELPARAASPQKGRVLYQARCQSCHQANGLGLKANPAQPGAGYLYPALAGPDSFNNGAGMGRVITAARYIKANMPLGKADLTSEQAFDVAAYLNSLPRPQKSGLEKDFPDRRKKPVDAPFGPWPDSFSAEQHRFGPFKPMLAGRTPES